jgi:hypothetical protein
LRYLQLLIPVKADIAKIEKEPESLTLIKTTADRWTEYCMNGTNIMRIILFLSILLITDREVTDTSNTGQDLRTTVFWKPDLITNNDGNASFNFYNADIKGVYKVVVEGIDENGNIGRQVYRYRVQ